MLKKDLSYILMKVGILTNIQHSLFSGGLANTTLALVELLEKLGHTTSIVNTSNVLWWDDCATLKDKYNIVHVDAKVHFDVMIECVPYYKNAADRKAIATVSIYFIRKNILIPLIEHSLYPIIDANIVYDGLTELWVFKPFCSSDEQQILETLSRLPVKRLPYIWTPNILEAYRAQTNIPLWLQYQAHLAREAKGHLPLWSTHIVETNTSSTSSCTIPLVTLRVAKENNFPSTKYTIHNADHILKSDFFKDNVVKHTNIDDLSGNYVGRQRLIDFVVEPMSCILSHIRFIPFRPYLLDLAWYGIPFVHNSPVFKEIGCYGRYYYPNNKISCATKCMTTLHDDFVSGTGQFTLAHVEEVRNNIINTYTIANNSILSDYKAAFVSLDQPKLKTEVSLKTEVAKEVAKEVSRVYKLLFTDMWDSFNSSYNFFTLLLEAADPSIKIEYYDSTNIGSITPDALLFGPFGSRWQQYPNVPKIHYTGENTPVIQGHNVQLNLGYAHADMVGDDYLRFPLWLLEIDWFHCNTSKIVNPKPIPLELCTQVNTNLISKKKKFCAFVVSNPNNPHRNIAYQWLDSYKPVDSAGAVFNNQGNVLAAGPGGGGGELEKVKFLMDYKYCITYENSSSQGYNTEKLLHAKAAGCIPIYWGDPKIERDFNTKGLIDARKVNSKEELIALVDALEKDTKAYLDMASVPYLDSYKVDWARRTLADCAGRIFKILTRKSVTVPRFISYESHSLASHLWGSVGERENDAVVGAQQLRSSTVEVPIVTTYATREYLPSLHQWLSSFEAQRKSIQGIEAYVYLGDDVPKETVSKLAESFKFVSFAYLPKIDVENFPDIFAAEHFAWKIYIYKDLCSKESFKGRMIFYLDAGIFVCRWPTEYMLSAQHNDICVLQDTEQYNKQWCHDTFVKKLACTKDELESYQIVGGIMIFRAGSAKATKYFAEAWNYAVQRDVIVGEKWSGLKDGLPSGHRHDQSILSILSLRHKLATYPLHNIYCDVTLRHTFLSQKYLYVHRGRFVIHNPFVDGIDNCFIINLKRRTDRLATLYKNTPMLKDAIVSTAVEGRTLQLTDSIARLFKPNDFMWKKAVLGCALSHLKLWYQLACEKPEINNYLVLEDDAKLSSSWKEQWLEALPHLPENYDIIYFGGILPPNKLGFETCKEPVNAYFSRVKENSFYGQERPNRYFHWCAYSYVLSKQGAQKVISSIEARDGYYTSADHMLCNPVDFMNIYFLDPLIAGCIQEDDPKYCAAEFNNFSRVDAFDSDLWNNDERFNNVQIVGDLNIAAALQDVRTQQSLKVELEPKVNADLKVPLPTNRFYTLDTAPLVWKDLYEHAWLSELLGNPACLQMDTVSYESDALIDPIFVLLKPDNHRYNQLFSKYEAQGKKFYVLHLGDEHATDSIDFYNFSSCAGVVRNYVRLNLPPKVLVIPLGYHYTLGQGVENPYERTPQLPFRTLIWSFFGTRWNSRAELLSPLTVLREHNVKLFTSWNDAQQLGSKEYLSNTLDSIFVPCIGGQNPETYRFYEALECGCIPIIVKDDDSSNYINYITTHIDILPLASWAQACALIQGLLNDKASLESYRHRILTSYRSMKLMYKDLVRKILNIV